MKESAARWRTPGTVALLLALQALMVFAFVFPGYKPTPHHVPVAFVGPQSIESTVAQKTAGKLSLRAYPSKAAAQDAIDHRDVYGALIVGPTGSELLTASAASLPVSQLLRSAADAGAAKPTVHDVAPLSANDPRGSTINLLFLPLITVCFTVVFALGSLKLRRSSLVASIAAFSLVGGVIVAAIIHTGLGALPGPFLGIAAIAALAIFSIALPTAGFQQILGPPGIAVGALLFLVLGNMASGNATAPELLPGFWRWVSQWLPPGAGGSALRNTAYFDGHALLHPLVVLGMFVTFGATLVFVADRVRGLRRAPTPARPRAEIAQVGFAK